MIELPGFESFNPHAEVRIYRRNLPHWRQDGATYFVTFRQADSIPAVVLAGWMEDRRVWYEANGLHEGLSKLEWQIRYQQIPEGQRLEFERRQARRLLLEIDKCHGSCLFTSSAAREILGRALLFFDQQRCRIGDFVSMPNHGHVIVLPLEGHSLEQLMHSIKRFTSTELGKENLKPGITKLWQQESHDHIIRDTEELLRIRRYIADNPRKANLTEGEFTYYRAEWLDEYAPME